MDLDGGGWLARPPGPDLHRSLLRLLIRMASAVVDPAGPSRLRLRLHVTAARLRHLPGTRR